MESIFATSIRDAFSNPASVPLFRLQRFQGSCQGFMRGFELLLTGTIITGHGKNHFPECENCSPAPTYYFTLFLPCLACRGLATLETLFCRTTIFFMNFTISVIACCLLEARAKRLMLNTPGISWFIFRGGWRGGRLDICKMGYSFVRASGYLIHYSIATAT